MIGGEIAPQPPTRVSFDTARSDGLKNSERESIEDNIAASKLFRTDGVWGHAVTSDTPHNDPHRPPAMAFISPT